MMASLTQTPEWKELLKDFSQFGESMQIRDLFDSDPDRFSNYRYVSCNSLLTALKIYQSPVNLIPVKLFILQLETGYSRGSTLVRLFEESHQ